MCNKVPFQTREDAKRFYKNIIAYRKKVKRKKSCKGRREKIEKYKPVVELSYYNCDECGFFHATSKL